MRCEGGPCGPGIRWEDARVCCEGAGLLQYAYSTSTTRSFGLGQAKMFSVSFMDRPSAVSVEDADVAGASGIGVRLNAIGVYARLRPENQNGSGDRDKSITLRRRYEQQRNIQVRNLEFSMDWVFDTDSTQQEVYEIVAEQRVSKVLEGYNVCLLAYGQTGSGKTYSMYGSEGDWKQAAEETHGLAPRSIANFFGELQTLSDEKQYLVTCSYVEVYNDQCNDLLGGRKGLQLRETRDGHVSVDGLRKEVVGSPEEVLETLNRGNASRLVAAMKMNDRSSRSHAIFSIGLAELGGDECGRLFLVDLAGMESSKKSFSVEGASSKPQRREEAKNINTSLYALGSVIERLSAGLRHHGESGGPNHVPYRDSKLTRLLQECLGGNCVSAMLVTLRTETENLEETIGTLRFAQRAKAVPVVVKPVQTSRGEASQLARELAAVKEELATAQSLVERFQRELGEQNTQSLTDQVRAIVAKIGGGSHVERVALLEVENQQLRNRNRALRVTSVWQRLMALRNLEARRTLERRAQAREETLLATRQDLQHTKAALEANTPGGPLAASISGGGTFTIARGKIVQSGAPTPGGNLGGMGSPLFSPRGARRGAIGVLSEEARDYAKFHEIATARKLALASRGYEMEGVFIDELFDEAKRQGVSTDDWHGFLRREIPSPAPGDDHRAADSKAPSKRKTRESLAAGAGRGPADLSATAPVGGSLSGGHRRGLQLPDDGARRRRPTGLKRVNLPFSSGVSIQAGGDGLAGSLSASQLLNLGAEYSSGADASLEATWLPPRADAAAAGAGVRSHGERLRRLPASGLQEETQGVTMQKAMSQGAVSQLTFRDGYEDWRGGMDLNLHDNLSATQDKGALPGRRAAPPAVPVDAMKRLESDLASALRHGERRADSAYALTTLNELMAKDAEVRSGPARRATDEAAKASLRAAAAAEGAREAAARAGAARAALDAEKPSGLHMIVPAALPGLVNETRTKVRLLPSAQLA